VAPAPEGGVVALRVLDGLGREVASAHHRLGPGAHRVALPTNRLQSGAYVVVVEAAGRRAVRRLAVVR
jgi:hypothetical protein